MKKLISLAVASMFATPPMAASAQDTNVTLFGSVQAEYATVDYDGFTSQALIGDDTGRSRFGLHVVEHLGHGFKTKAHYEQGFNTGSGDLSVARERWIALANNTWGELKNGMSSGTQSFVQGGMNKANTTTTAPKRKVSSFTVGAIHNLSKRSSLFGGYQRNMVDDRNAVFRDSNVHTVGMRNNF